MPPSRHEARSAEWREESNSNKRFDLHLFFAKKKIETSKNQSYSKQSNKETQKEHNAMCSIVINWTLLKYHRPWKIANAMDDEQVINAKNNDDNYW